MPKTTKRDWAAFWVHFVFGAVLGAVIGLGIWSRPAVGLYDSGRAGLFCIGGGAMIGGLLAGFGGEDFWASFRR